MHSDCAAGKKEIAACFIWKTKDCCVSMGKGERPLHSSNTFYEYGFWSCFACRWISFLFKSQFQHFNHNTVVLVQQSVGKLWGVVAPGLREGLQLAAEKPWGLHSGGTQRGGAGTEPWGACFPWVFRHLSPLPSSSALFGVCVVFGNAAPYRVK